MRDMLQIVGGIFITGLMTALILGIFWGIIYILVSKAREYYFRGLRTVK
jgi:hypothetical protein